MAGLISICVKNLRDVDYMGRLGGDEFIILLPETDVEGGMLLAERIRKLIEEHKVSTEMGDINVTASLGVSALTGNDMKFASLLSNADSAMYRAKKAGGNQAASL